MSSGVEAVNPRFHNIICDDMVLVPSIFYPLDDVKFVESIGWLTPDKINNNFKYPLSIVGCRVNNDIIGLMHLYPISDMSYKSYKKRKIKIDDINIQQFDYFKDISRKWVIKDVYISHVNGKGTPICPTLRKTVMRHLLSKTQRVIDMYNIDKLLVVGLDDKLHLTLSKMYSVHQRKKGDKTVSEVTINRKK